MSTASAPRRVRATEKTGYVRVSVTIPRRIHRQILRYLRQEDGLTMSAFMTLAGRDYAAMHTIQTKKNEEE